MKDSYATPNAFRAALKDHLRAHARPHGPWPLADLQRQFGYDRLLARLYLHGTGWVVKGATALLAREIAVRHTIDLDIYRASSRAEAEENLRSAAGADLGDWFRFELAVGAPIAEGQSGVRLGVLARIGTIEWTRFHVDLVASTVRMTGTPEEVPPLIPVSIPGLDRPCYQAYPLVDHIADKTCAVLERHGPDQRASTRFKDLVDLVTLARHARVDADAQCRAVRAEAGRRALDLPVTFDVPDRTLWQVGYAAEARRAVLPMSSTLEEALAVVKPFLDPVLAGTATGTWTRELAAWCPAPADPGGRKLTPSEPDGGDELLSKGPRMRDPT